MLSDDPKPLKLWNETLKKMAASKRNNLYKKYWDNLEKGVKMSNKELSDIWKYVRRQFKKEAKDADHKIQEEMHHWNYPKVKYPEQIANPKNITEPINRPIHESIHTHTTSNPLNKWKGPIDSQYEININSTPIK